MATEQEGTLAQEGTYDAEAGSWSEVAFAAEESLSTVVGQRFTGFTGQSRAESGTYTGTVNLSASQVPCTVRLYAQGNSTPEEFSFSNGPLLEAQMSRTSDLLLASEVLLGTGNQNLEYALDIPKLNAALNMSGEWEGTLNLTLHFRTADQSAVTVSAGVSTLTLSIETRLFSGIEVDERTYHTAQSRADICPITGHEGLREQWVWSEYHRRYVIPGQEDPDTDEWSNPPRTKRRLVNERGG